jgi:osmotically inducible lipoprotein OsmB
MIIRSEIRIFWRGRDQSPTRHGRYPMKTFGHFVLRASLVTVALGLSGCAGMSQQDRNTAIGAGAGALLGRVVTGGSTVGAVGGAAVGGVIGNQVKTTR